MQTYEHGARQRFVADRFRRIWALTQEIADRPGQSRHEFSRTFSLSERQIQADLNIIRTDMRLPLIRHQGYRFADEGTPSGEVGLTLRDALVLLAAAKRAPAEYAVVLAKLPSLFPPHLQPLVRQLLALLAQRGQKASIFSAVTEAVLCESWVRLDYPKTYALADRAPVVKPELLMPYLGSWYLLAECRSGGVASRMYCLDDVAGVTLVAAS